MPYHTTNHRYIQLLSTPHLHGSLTYDTNKPKGRQVARKTKETETREKEREGKNQRVREKEMDLGGENGD